MEYGIPAEGDSQQVDQLYITVGTKRKQQAAEQKITWRESPGSPVVRAQASTARPGLDPWPKIPRSMQPVPKNVGVRKIIITWKANPRR